MLRQTLDFLVNQNQFTAAAELYSYKIRFKNVFHIYSVGLKISEHL